MRLHSSRIIWLIMLLVSACNLSYKLPEKTVVVPSPTPADDMPIGAWQTIADGLDWQVYVPNDNGLGQLVALRIDPQKYEFRAQYQPAQAYSIDEWQARTPSAVAIINANFFDLENKILGLLVSDGLVYGHAYQERGGTFAVSNGIVRLYSNIVEPYKGQVFEQAVQAFPMLIQNHQQAFFDNRNDNATRRSLIAQDSQGRIILMATPYLGLTLSDLSAYLLSTDLDIVTALNLDGGGSTMLAIPPLNYQIASFDPVPAVLAIYAR